jgi:hypothetical protein
MNTPRAGVIPMNPYSRNFGHFRVVSAGPWLKIPQKVKKKERNAFLFDKTIVLL